MTTKKYKVDEILERAYCECGGEIMGSMSSLLLFKREGDDILWPNICSKCMKEHYLKTIYPKTERVYVELQEV